MFHFRDVALRESFSRALEKEKIHKGPYLEATPNFSEGASFRNLCESHFTGNVGPLLTGVQSDRPLYRHQEEAVRAYFANRNFVVATGTGSGKTEAFLYPILLHLFEEFESGELEQPGVRALILYPMNALANDQRERIAEIAGKLQEAGSPFSFTYGRYTGETPNNRADSRRTAVERQPGELGPIPN